VAGLRITGSAGIPRACIVMLRCRQMPVQYTIRGVPREVDRELRRRARQRKVSLNQLLLDELQGAAGVRKKYRALESVAGTWVDDAEFDRALKLQRRIDPALWK
jgi:hypothetical protein